MPVQVVGITDATAIAAGTSHSCALHRDGTISCWGSNSYGQLGNGTTGNSSVPVQVFGIADATAITTGERHSCALHQTGTISCWGSNWDGELGNGQSGRNAGSLIPVQVTGITDATAITAGGAYSCALHQNGTISCWGNNYDGQLGNGQSQGYSELPPVVEAHSNVPVQVTGITDATAVTVSVSSHSCALHRGGTISCWGDNEYGNLGIGRSGEYSRSSVPVQVLGITDATAITAGFRYSCALRRGGTISCWGLNWNGQLGNGNGGDSVIPVQVVDITDATAIAAGGAHSCALHRTGTISCWGYNRDGRLGNGTRSNSVIPVQVTGIGG